MYTDPKSNIATNICIVVYTHLFTITSTMTPTCMHYREKCLCSYFTAEVSNIYTHAAASNILIVSYESMKKNLPQAVKTIADFLGYRLSPETISKIADQTTFKAMKKNPAGNGEYYDKYRREKSSPFMRKGVVGDWRNYFTEEQSARMDEECAKRFSGSGLEFDYGSQLPSSRL